MKKLLLMIAISVVATSNSLNAATIYEKDNFIFKIDGDIQIQLRQRVGNNEDIHVDFDDSEIKNKLSYDLGNGWIGFAEAHFDNGKDVDGSVESEETFIGLKSKAFKMQIGRMDYATDEFATEKAIEAPTNESAFDAGELDGTDVILFEGKLGVVTILFSHDFGDSDRNSELESSDLYISADFGAIKVGVATQSLKRTANSSRAETHGINIEFDTGTIDIAADYSQSDADAENADLEVSNLSVAFPVAKTTKMALGITKQSNRDNDSPDSWYANVVYKFPQAKNFSVFAEIQDTDAVDSDLGFLAGMRLKF